MAHVLIKSVNEKDGTFVLSWEGKLEYNYNIPLDSTGKPFSGIDLVEWLARLGYDTFKYLERPAPDYSEIKDLVGTELDLTVELAELDQEILESMSTAAAAEALETLINETP